MCYTYWVKGDNMLDFDSIAKDIIEKEKFQSLKNDPHHGLTRYIHTMHVAKNTYRVAKLLKMDYISATRGALLHDYFNDEDYKSTKGVKKYSMHPTIALNNARREYALNQKEENIIISHMYPFGKTKPKYKESWLVTLVDKQVAIKECSLYKWKEQLAVITIALTNLINKL